MYDTPVIRCLYTPFFCEEPSFFSVFVSSDTSAFKTLAPLAFSISPLASFIASETATSTNAFPTNLSLDTLVSAAIITQFASAISFSVNTFSAPTEP
ncbi:hypothetical protein D3C73_1235340 [compost metagenome]